MAIVLLAARVILALVFVVAGVAKLADQPGSRRALGEFGVPALLAGPLGLILPLVELAVALALLVAATAWVGAIAALALLLLFAVGIGVSLARGRRPACHCFGQLSAGPTGWPTLIRDLIFAVLAGLVVGFGPEASGPGVLGWVADVSAGQALGALGVLVVLVLLLADAWLMGQLFSQNGRLLLRVEALEKHLGLDGAAIGLNGNGAAHPPDAGLPIGAPAPAFRLPNTEGNAVTLDELLERGRPVLLIFAEPGCGPCAMLLAEAGRWQSAYASTLTIGVISRGTAEAHRSLRLAFGLTGMLLQQEDEVAEMFRSRGTPSAVLLRPDGRIASPLAQGGDAVRSLVAEVIKG